MVYPNYNTNTNYNGEIKTYKKWVDLNKRRVENLYLSRDNVDDYYKKVVEVSRININIDSASRIHRALQWYSDNIEPPDNQQPPLVIRDIAEPSSLVNQSLFRRELRYIQWVRENGRKDLHADLPTNTYLFADHHTIMRWLFGNAFLEPKWLKFAISFCCTYATYMRLDSLRKLISAT